MSEPKKYMLADVMKYEPIFKQKIRSYVKDGLYQEDLLQDFYMKVFINEEKIPQVEDELMKWCVTVLMNWIRTRMNANIVKNSYRLVDELCNMKELDANYIRSTQVIDYIDYDLDDYEFSKMENFFSLVVPDVIWEEYIKLEQIHKEILLERFVQNKKMKEIAKEKGMTIQDIKNYIFKFRVNILESLDMVEGDSRSLTKLNIAFDC